MKGSTTGTPPRAGARRGGRPQPLREPLRDRRQDARQELSPVAQGPWQEEGDHQ